MRYLVCFQSNSLSLHIHYNIIRIYKNLDEALCYIIDSIVIENMPTVAASDYFVVGIDDEQNVIDLTNLLSQTRYYVCHNNDNYYYLSKTGNSIENFTYPKLKEKLNLLNRLNKMSKESLYSKYNQMNLKKCSKIFTSKKYLIKKIYEKENI